MHQDKKQILIHYENSMMWVESLINITEVQWRTPIEPGKWTVAEVIGHLTIWDEFMLSQRVPFLFTDESLPKGPDVDEMNAKSASISRAQSKEDTIEKFLNSRRHLLSAIHLFEDEQWQHTFKIGESELTLYRYFSELMEHDQHHILQIKNVIKLKDSMFW